MIEQCCFLSKFSVTDVVFTDGFKQRREEAFFRKRQSVSISLVAIRLDENRELAC